MDDCLIGILCCCCDKDFCNCLADCCSKCFECPGHCISGSCCWMKNSLSSMDCTCLSNVLCACWKCTDSDCSKLFNNSTCRIMEENCLKVFNCSEAISGFSQWFQMFWMMRIKCLGALLNCLCECMPGICFVTLGGGDYSNNADHDASRKKHDNSTKEDQNYKKKSNVEEDCQIIVYNEDDNIEEVSFQPGSENNHEIYIQNFEAVDKDEE